MTDQMIDDLLPIIAQTEDSTTAAIMQSRKAGHTITADQVVSPAGAVGRYQVMPNTARLLGYDPRLLTDPVYNKQVARSAVADLIKQHGPDREAILAGYNASPKVVAAWKRAGRNPAMLPKETQNYLTKAAKLTNKYAQAAPDPALNGPGGKVLGQKMVDAGFTPSEVANDQTSLRANMSAAGFTPRELDDYFGTKPVDTKSIDNLAQQDVMRQHDMHPSDSLFQDFMGGWMHGSSWLALQGAPGIQPRSATLPQMLASGAGQMASDAPAMAVGAIGGFFSGGPLAAGAGSMALPEATRNILMDHYENPNGHKTWSDFWASYSAAGWNTAKAATEGLIFGPAGKIASMPLKYVGSKLLSSAAEMFAGNVAAQATGAALDGKIPDANSAISSSLLLLAAHGVTKTVGTIMPRSVPSTAAEQMAEHMRKIYRKTGIPPWEQAARAQNDPGFSADLHSRDVNFEPITGKFDQVRSPDIKFATEKAPPPADAKPEATVLEPNEQETVMMDATDRGIPDKMAAEYKLDPQRLKDDPEYANKHGLRILKDLMYHFKGDKEAAFIAYNSTIGEAEAWIARGRKDMNLPPETQRALVRASSGGAFDGGNGKKPPGGGGSEPPPDNRQRKVKDDTIKPNADTILDQGLGLVEGEKPPPSLYARSRDLASAAYDQFISELGPFKRMDDALHVKPGQIGIEDAFRSTYASNERAGHFLTSGGVDALTFKRTSNEGLMDAYARAKKDGGTREGFVGFRLALRFIEKAGQGVDTGWRSDQGTLEERLIDAKKAVTEKRGVYGEALAIATRINNQKLNYMRDSGLYSEAQIEKMQEDNKAWFPHQRVQDSNVKVSGRGYSRFLPGRRLSKMEGSDKQIIEPVVAEIESFTRGIASADRNRAIGAIVGSQEHIDTLGLKRISREEKVTYYDKDGNKISGVGDNGGPPLDPDAHALAQKEAYNHLGPGEFPFWRDGKLEIWSTPDEELAKTIRGASDVDPGLIRGLSFFARLQRSGITSMPDYLLKMVVRDQFTTPVLEKFGGLPFQNFMLGTYTAIAKPEIFMHFLRNGGMGSSLASMDAEYVQRGVDKMFHETGVYTDTINTVAHPVEAARLMMERLDAMSRLGMFVRQERAGVQPMRAAMHTRRAYIDFKERAGLGVVNWWASMTTFLRPKMLGMDQLGRSLKDDPVGVGLRGLALITIPSAALYAINWLQDQEKTKDDPSRYDQIPSYQRDTMFILPEIGGEHIRIPRSQGEVGIVAGGLMERSLKYWETQDPIAFKDWATNFAGQFSGNVTPTFALPMLEHTFGKSFFTMKNLVPASLEGSSGYMQYTENTTDMAKNLSRFIHSTTGMDSNPIIMENYIKEWGGTAATDALHALNALKADGQPWQLADVPFVGSFIVRHPTMQATTIQNFYDAYHSVDKDVKDFNLALKRNNEQEINETTADGKALVSLKQTADRIHELYSVIVGTNDDKTMKTGEKRQFIEDMYATIISLSRNGIELANALQSKVNDKKKPVH